MRSEPSGRACVPRVVMRVAIATMVAPLASVRSVAESAVTSAGYFGLMGIMALETIFPPIPSEIVLPLAGFEVGQGELDFLAALAAATLGAVAGSLALYALARFGGRSAVLRFRRVLRVSDAELDRAERWFDKRGTAVVFFGRMVPGARSLVSHPSRLRGDADVAVHGGDCGGLGGVERCPSDRRGPPRAELPGVDRYLGPIATGLVAVLALALVIASIRWARARRRM